MSAVISLPTSVPLTFDYLRSINYNISRSGPALSLDDLRANPLVQMFAAADLNNPVLYANSDIVKLVKGCKMICSGGEQK